MKGIEGTQPVSLKLNICQVANGFRGLNLPPGEKELIETVL